MDDYISRRAAIEAVARVARENFNLSNWYKYFLRGLENADREIRALPSAQPLIFGNLEPLTPELKAGAKIVINTIIDNTDDVIEKSAWRGIRSFIDDLPNGILVPVRKREEPEIIRCKDCKYCEHWYADKGRCFLWHDGGIDVFEEGFCNYAERRANG